MKELIFTFFLLFNMTAFINGQCIIDTSNIVTFEFDNHTYEIVQENLNWANAAACAVERNGYLVEINSQQEQDTIYNAILNLGINPDNTEAPDGVGSYIWIGANDIATNGIWIWDGNNDGVGIQFWQGQRSGSPVSGLYNNWGDEPDFQDAVGIAIIDWPLGIAGQWNDIFSTNQLYYIIEKDTVTSTTTSINEQSVIESKSAVRAYPVPVHDKLKVEANNIELILIYNNQGNICKSIRSDFHNIDMSDLPQGIYTLKIISFDNKYDTKKVVKIE